MTKEEVGCRYALQARLRQEVKWIKVNFGKQWMVRWNDKSIVDFNGFMREPLQYYRLGGLKRRIKEWGYEHSI